MIWKPRIRTVLLFVNLVIILLPLFGIQALRLYENELIRQTEASLIAQGIYLREEYRAALLIALGAAKPRVDPASYGLELPPAFAEKSVAVPDDDDPLPAAGAGAAYLPIQATLDMVQENVRPPAEEAQAPAAAAEPHARKVGDHFSPLLKRSQRYSLAGARIVDYRGIVVASSRGELDLSLSHREEVARALKGEVLSLIRARVAEATEPPLASISRGGRIRIFLAMPILNGNRILGAVVLSRTPIDIQKAMYLNRFALMRFAGALLLIALAVSILTAKTISRPIAALIAQAKELKNDARRAAEPLANPGSHEIRELSQAVADMARAMQQRSDYVMTFAQHVSHEFKTPLAAFHGIIELLRDHLDTMSKEERTRFLDMLSRDATRMQHLVERLLQLAKADVAAPASGSADLGTCLQAAVARFRDLGLAVEVAEPTAKGGLLVRMAPETLDSVLATLLENAKQHGGVGVNVRVGAGPAAGAPGMAEIRVQDDGPGISAANRARVFTPFFTTARETGGTGLGLSIVRSLAEAHGGSIALDEHGLSGRGIGLRLLLPII